MKSVIRTHNDALRFVDRATRELGATFDKPQLIELKQYRPPRSLPQNAKMHVMIGELAKEVGYSASELKDWFKLEHGPKQRFTFGGIDKMIPKSTASYTKMEMIEFIGQIERVGAEMGFVFEEQP
jgi:hypothetical protein